MANLYVCGSDTYHCLPVAHSDNDGEIQNSFVNPFRIPSVSEIEFTHFYSVYQKKSTRSPYSWFVNGLGLAETQIFASTLRIKQVAACKNSVVGISEDGKLFRISLEADDNRELISLKTSLVRTEDVTQSISFKKVTSNENDIYGLHSSSEMSRIYKVEDRIECVAEFPGKYIEEFSVGYGHFVALSDTGALWNWGYGGRSELATNSEINVMKVCETPRRIEFFDDLPCIVVKVVCGGWHTLALTSEGDIYSWGWNESKQLGHNASVTSKSVPYPVDLGSAEEPVTHIAAGSRHSVALLKSGRVFSWGRNEEGQTGLGVNEFYEIPTEISKNWDGTACNIKCSKWATFIYTK